MRTLRGLFRGMSRRPILLSSGFALLSLAFTWNAFADGIVLSPQYSTYVSALAQTTGLNESQSSSGYISSMPGSATATAVTASGAGSSIGTATLTNTAFTVDFTQARAGSYESLAETEAQLVFTVPITGSYNYSISGSYTATGYATQLIELKDLDSPSGTYAFGKVEDAYYDYLNYGNNTNPSLTFTASNTPDDNSTLYNGSLPYTYTNIDPGSSNEGQLNPGDTYEFYFRSYTQAFPNNDAGGSGQGSITITFTPVDQTAAAPLPSSGLAGMILLTVFGGWTAFRRYRASTVV